MEISENEVQKFTKVWYQQKKGIGMGKYKKKLLAHSQQLYTLQNLSLIHISPVNNGDTTASVKTGDGSLVGMFATIALLSVAGYTVLRRKENQ